MGIDRKDVRTVCHFNIPKSMEAFYQESGRAGRDQLPSRSILYYGRDDRRRMEFILYNAENKKLQSSNSLDRLQKNSMSDFKQMVEYCEGSGCRRKIMLESFGEQVPESLCNKTCDACKHPDIVSRHLENLTNVAFGQSNKFSQILISRPADTFCEENFSEFWNRKDDDDDSCSEEDISDCDDTVELSQSTLGPNFSKKPGITEKIELLQCAEEDYYRRKKTGKQIIRPEKNAISEMLRGASKQRLLDALKQAQLRLGDVMADFEASATLLEIQCFKKYGKSGKSFYYSQVAGTVRWLSTASSTDITKRLGTRSACALEDSVPKEDTSATPSTLLVLDKGSLDVTREDHHGIGRSQTSKSKMPVQSKSQTTNLPPIPSFSEFVNSREAKKNRAYGLEMESSATEDESSKRMRLE